MVHRAPPDAARRGGGCPVHTSGRDSTSRRRSLRPSPTTAALPEYAGGHLPATGVYDCDYCHDLYVDSHTPAARRTSALDVTTRIQPGVVSAPAPADPHTGTPGSALPRWMPRLRTPRCRLSAPGSLRGASYKCSKRGDRGVTPKACRRGLAPTSARAGWRRPRRPATTPPTGAGSAGAMARATSILGLAGGFAARLADHKTHFLPLSRPTLHGLPGARRPPPPTSLSSSEAAADAAAAVARTRAPPTHASTHTIRQVRGTGKVEIGSSDSRV
jgi:hypothetical protein